MEWDKRKEFEQLRSQLLSEENEEMVIEAYMLAAKFMKKYYDALVKEGFTPDQAITIVAHHGVIPKFS